MTIQSEQLETLSITALRRLFDLMQSRVEMLRLPGISQRLLDEQEQMIADLLTPSRN